MLWILNKIGINKTNSKSYKIKKTHSKLKFKLIWMFKESYDLKPHS